MLPRGFPREAGDLHRNPQNKMQCSTSARCHLKPKNPMSPSRSSRLRVRLYPHLHMWQLAFHLMHRNLQNKVLRCTSGFLAPHHSSPIQPETEPPGGFPLFGGRCVPASGMAPRTCQIPAGERSPAPRSAAPRLFPATPAYNASISRTIACQLYLVRTRSFA